jgi:hypothetical protein
MASFIGEVTGVGVKYPKSTDKEGNTFCEGPVAVCSVQAASADEHNLADALGEMIGKRVKINITLEQSEL